jgi:ubiquinone/menaquinone biosynthesis C-methylase UbiE
MDTKLKNEVWEKEKYWALAEKGSLDTEHPGMKLLLKIAQGKHSILDLGCGEGTRLGLIKGDGKNLTGIDVSEMAIKKAKAKYPQNSFVSGNIEKLPFPDGSFDFVYSAFVFEHLDKPEEVLQEALRVLKPGGKLLIIAPNYGAPNRASPPYKGNRINKLINGLIHDFSLSNELDWQKVKPITDADTYEMDWDTTVEPYLGSLIQYLKSLGLKIIKAASSWEEEESGASLMQKLFRFLGERSVYPFKYWGPHLVMLAEK